MSSRSGSRDRGRRSPSRSPSRSRSRGRDRGRSRSRSRSRGRARGRSRSRSRDRGRRRSRSRSHSRGRGGGGGGGRESGSNDPTFGKKVYVGDLSYNTRDDDLRKIGEEFGPVLDVFMPRGGDGSTRGFGFLTYGTVREAEDAADKLDGDEIDGRRVKANIARARPPRPEDRYGGGGGGGGGGRGGYGSSRPERGTKIYVGNLPMDTSESDLEKLYDRFGRIRLLELKRVVNPPLFGFVEYEDERDAADAVAETNQKEFRGAHLRVEFANSGR